MLVQGIPVKEGIVVILRLFHVHLHKAVMYSLQLCIHKHMNAPRRSRHNACKETAACITMTCAHMGPHEGL